jgi:diguanylate cyclase (GGDEF)-like protein
VRILVADDDPVSRQLLKSTLGRWGYEVVTAADGAEALRILQDDDAPQMAILDWIMPGLDGIHVCQEVRRQVDRAYTFLLLLTVNNRPQDLVAGLEAGADDYLIKPCDTLELQARLGNGKRLVGLHNQLLAACAALRERAMRDSLTGLWNHVAILEILEQEWEHARKRGALLGVIMADLDHFKRINDTHGHRAGDVVLGETIRRMKDSLRPHDAFGRYGGEEFLVVLPGMDAEALLGVAERLRLAVADRPVAYGSRVIPVTLSLGVAVEHGSTPVDADTLLQAADDALYRAKGGGRNRVEAGTVGSDVPLAVSG